MNKFIIALFASLAINIILVVVCSIIYGSLRSARVSIDDESVSESKPHTLENDKIFSYIDSLNEITEMDSLPRFILNPNLDVELSKINLHFIVGYRKIILDGVINKTSLYRMYNSLDEKLDLIPTYVPINKIDKENSVIFKSSWRALAKGRIDQLDLCYY